MKTKLLYLFSLVLLLLIPIFALFPNGLPITHDGQDHVARIANFYQSLHEGNLIPRWAANLNWGYGHPILEFLYPLPSYLASLFHYFGFSFIDSIKIVYGTGMFFSGIFMYLWLCQFLNRKAALIGGLMYVFAPYRFVELYVRGDIGENLAFIFIPLTLYFVLAIFNQTHPSSRKVVPSQLPGEGKKYKKEVLLLIAGSTSLACLILSHNAMALMFIPFIIFYFFYIAFSNYKQSKNQKCFLQNMSYFLLFIILGFGLSAFFWVPGLLEAKYTLRNIVTRGGYIKNFAHFSALLYGKWSYGGSGQFTQQLGVFQWLALLGTPVIVYFVSLKKRRDTILISGLFLYTLGAIFLMLPVSNNIWLRIILLQNFQFPWRFLAVPVFTLSVLAAIAVSELFSHQTTETPAFAYPKCNERARMKKKGVCNSLIVLSIIIAVIGINKEYWHANGYIYKPDSFFSGVYAGTTDTGESAPIWSVRFMEHRPKVYMEIIDGNGLVKEVLRNSTKHVYLITANTKVRLRENTLYFPGWEVLIDGKNTNIEFQDIKNRGLITFYVTTGKHIVSVLYNETRLRIIADIISLITLVGIISLFFVKNKNNFEMFALERYS